MTAYPVAIVPTNDYFEHASWVYEGEALPEPDEEITVTAVEYAGEEFLEESAVVRVTSVDEGLEFPITASPL
jgi:hypothetical protein